jgi:hypothetical protein
VFDLKGCTDSVSDFNDVCSRAPWLSTDPLIPCAKESNSLAGNTEYEGNWEADGVQERDVVQ